jgi:hypothetical protein
MRDAFEFVYDQLPRRELTGASGEVSRSEDEVLGDKSELGIGAERIVLSAGSGHEIGSTVAGTSAAGASSAIMRRTASSRLKSGLERNRASTAGYRTDLGSCPRNFSRQLLACVGQITVTVGRRRGLTAQG